MESTYMKSMPERWGIACRWIPSILIFTFLCLVSCQVEERNSALGEFRVNLTPDVETTAISKSSDHSVIPEAGDFQISIVSKDGTVNEYYEHFRDMEEYLTLPVGEYEFIANYSRQGEEGFSAPTLGGTKSFSIVKGQTTSLDVTCTLTSTKVTVNLSNEFVKYFSTYYSVGVKSAKEKLFYFDENTEEELYLQPGALYMEVVAVKQNGTSGTFYPLSLTDTKAAEHYDINLTVNEGEVGGEKLIITFHDGVEEQEVEIDLSDAAITAKEPFFTPTGFVSGEVIEIAEGTDLGELSVLITARGGFASCIIKTESAYLTLQEWEPTINLIGISTFDEQVLKKFGLDWTPGLTTANNANSNLQMSVLNFSGLIPLLRTYTDKDGNEHNEHMLTLVVTDQNGKKSDDLKLIIHTKKPNFKLHTPEAGIIGVSSVYLTVDLDDNGDANQIVIQSKDEYGVWKDRETTVLKSDGNTHSVLAKLPVENKPLTIRAKYNTIVSNEQILQLTVPEFEIEIADEADIWASKVYLTILPQNPDHLEGIKKYLIVYANNYSVPVSFDGDKAVISGLTPDTKFTIKGTCGENVYSEEITFDTESALVLPNSDFEEGWSEFYRATLSRGGRYRNTYFGQWQTPEKEVVGYQIEGWSTVNAKTIPENASNKNTWYIVPSMEPVSESFDGSYGIKLQNVAWDNKGVSISDYTAILGGATYCTNYPSNITNKSAGKFFLGDYLYNHVTNEEIYNEGIGFTSRPSSISGYYIFTDLGNDMGGTVSITVENRENETISLGQGFAVLTEVDGYTYFKVPVTYDIKDKKATHLKVMFTSSTKSSYNQAEESENIKTTNDIPNAVSTGSELYLDNIQLNYE